MMKPRLRHDPSIPASWTPRWLGEIPWRYTAAEIRADGAVHGVGIALSLLALVGFIVAPPAGPAQTVSVAIYLATLITSLVASALYNLWPVSQPKWILRRFDHSAIFLLIAGTYTPFMVRVGAWWLLAAVWTVAAGGIALKVLRAGRGDKLAIGLYLALGWSGVMIGGSLIETFSTPVLVLIGAGGLTYTTGVIFHVWERLPFQNVVWHSFVLVGSALHYGAVWLATTAGT